jgi:diguanylate cyclase (GGDEF)-like protein
LSNALEKVSKVPEGNEVSQFPILNPQFPTAFAVLFVDLDRFKIVNDSMGHLVGDQLLTEVAQRLNCVVSENYFVARFGGDEFALMLENISDKANLQECVNHILQQLGQPYTLNNDTFNTTASIGIALNNQKYENADELLRDADTAMYEAKKQGGNKFVIFQSGMHENIVNMLRMERDLRKALEREEFCLYYQPIISLETHKTVGLEALVRWEHPEQGMISPELFIPLTEETGLIKELGLWVFDTACVQLRRWQTQFAHHANLGMNINVSPVQMKQSHLVRDIHDIIEKTGIEPPTCRVEITEGAMMQNPKTALTVLNDLKSLNVLLYIDDFGTGYSSLSYLQQFPIDALKIDKSFIDKIEASARSAQVVRAIIALGKAFDLRVVAEGVENALQVSMLKLAHCNHLQGYFFSRPLDAQSIEAFLRVETHD